MASNGTTQDILVTMVTTEPTSVMPPHDGHGAVENVCITLAVLSLVTINVLLFLFWRYKALGKSPLQFNRYSSDCETYASLHEPVIGKEAGNTHPPSRAREILKKYASTVACVGQSKALSKSNSSLYASSSSSSGSGSSLEAPDISRKPVAASERKRTMTTTTKDRRRTATTERKRAEDKQGILDNVQEIDRVDASGNEYEESPIKFRVGHPEEDSPTTGGESDCQVYCEVMNYSSKRYGCHLKPVSIEYCKDKTDGEPAARISPNNNTITVSGHAVDPDGSENIYENYRIRNPTSPFASIMKSAAVARESRKATPNATCRTISGDYATCDANGEWRPTSFAFCHDVPTPPESQFPVIRDHLNDENPTYEQFMEPNDPIYSQQVIRQGQRSKRARPAALPRESCAVSSQPIYERASFEQPIYENLATSSNFPAYEVDFDLYNAHLDIQASGLLASSDRQINISPSARKHPTIKCEPLMESRHTLKPQRSTEQKEVELDRNKLYNAHLNIQAAGHLTASDSRLDISTSSHKQPTKCELEIESRHAALIAQKSIEVEASHSSDVPSSPRDGAVSSDAIESDAAQSDDSQTMSGNKSSFQTIAREFAEEYLDDYDPEETFPVMQMLSDRYSTGNFLNKFY